MVASRYAAWHTAEAGGVGLMEYFQEDFFYGDETGWHGALASPDDGKAQFGAAVSPPPGLMSDYWAFIEGNVRGESRQRASVEYEPPGSVYRYTLQRIGETTAREYQTWHWRDFNFWRFFGERIMTEPTERRDDVMSAFDEAGRAGLGGITDPVLRQALEADHEAHRDRLDRWYGRWISTWRRG